MHIKFYIKVTDNAVWSAELYESNLNFRAKEKKNNLKKTHIYLKIVSI